MGKYARRVDDNHKEIMETYRKCGASVKDVSKLPGFCDIVVGYRQQNFLVEVKDGAKTPSARKLTKAEENFHTNWKGQIAIICSPMEVVDHIEDIRKLTNAKKSTDQLLIPRVDLPVKR